jgi:hypothetical protein
VALPAPAPLSHCRFFNSGLRPLYEQAPVVTKNSRRVTHPHVVSHQSLKHVLSSNCAQKGGFRFHEGRVTAAPLDAVVHTPKPALSKPLAPAAAQGAGDGPPAPKKRKVSMRKRPIHGQLRSYCVRMIPTAEQTKALKLAFSAGRKAYNWAVHRINTTGPASFFTIRNEFKDLPEGHDAKPTWSMDVKRQFVNDSVFQAVKSCNTSMANREAGNIDHFELHYRSHKRTKTEVLDVESDPTGYRKTAPKILPSNKVFANDLRNECLIQFGGHFKAAGPIRLQDHRRVIEKLVAEEQHLSEGCKIQWDKRTDTFHFLYCYDCPPAAPDPDPQFETKRLCATDLGAEPFAMWYSPTEGGTIGELLAGMRNELEMRCIKIDERTSKVVNRGQNWTEYADRSVRSHKRRQETFHHMKVKLAKERNRLRNWMKAAHYASANFLLRRYDAIIVPKLKVAEMVRKDDRVFGSKTTRAMYTWSFYKFVQRLEWAAYRYSGRHVFSDATEPGTSKTCGICGWWNTDLEGKKEFVCGNCGCKMHRDANGARNNFLAYLGRRLGRGPDGVVLQPAAGH